MARGPILLACLLLTAVVAMPGAAANPVCAGIGWAYPLPPPGWTTTCDAIDFVYVVEGNVNAFLTCMNGYSPLFDPPINAWFCAQNL